MTSEEYDKLTDEEKRIKIAELCGWTKCGSQYATCKCPSKVRWGGGSTGINPMDGKRWTLPDYLNDLNAMHEAEKVLDNGVDDTRYINRLVTICEDSIYHIPFRSVRATAEQRAKAFVLTLME